MAAESVNAQITDAVSQSNVKVLGDAPAMALGNLYQAISQSIALAAGNAVTSQQQSNVIYQAATTMGVTGLYSLGTAAAGQASEAIAHDEAPAPKG
ncbi:MAG: RebB family R body protein [Nannocystaceae bacterium]|nr:RebB family R body protein [Myxococcales bacterium]